MYITSTHFKLWLVKLLLWKNWLHSINKWGKWDSGGEGKCLLMYTIVVCKCVGRVQTTEYFNSKSVNLLLYIWIYQLLLHFLSQIRAQCAFVHCSIMQVILRTWQHQSTKSLLWLFWLMSRYIGCQLSYDSFYIRLLKKAREGS